MSQTLQNQILLAKSMNGIITLSDGAGTTITNGQIVTSDVSSNSISAGSVTLGVLDLNSALELERYDTLVVPSGGSVSLWEKGKSYFADTMTTNGISNTGAMTTNNFTYSNNSSAVTIVNPYFGASSGYPAFSGTGSYAISGWTFNSANTYSIFLRNTTIGSPDYRFMGGLPPNGSFVLVENQVTANITMQQTLALSAGAHILFWSSYYGWNSGVKVTLNIASQSFTYDDSATRDTGQWRSRNFQFNVNTAGNYTILFTIAGNSSFCDVFFANFSLTRYNALQVTNTAGTTSTFISPDISVINSAYFKGTTNAEAMVLGGSLTMGTPYGSNNISINNTFGTGSTTNNNNNICVGLNTGTASLTTNNSVFLSTTASNTFTSVLESVVIGALNVISNTCSRSYVIGSSNGSFGNRNISIGYKLGGDTNNGGSDNVCIGRNMLGGYNGFGTFSVLPAFNYLYGTNILTANYYDMSNCAFGQNIFQNLRGNNNAPPSWDPTPRKTSFNIGIGINVGQTPLVLNNSVLIGCNANASDGLTNVVALGHGCLVTTSNTIQLGSNSETVAISGNLKSGANTITSTQLGYLTSVTGGIVNTDGSQTILGTKTFSGGINATLAQTINFGSNAPTMSGANIQSGTIPSSAVTNVVDLNSAQTITAVKTTKVSGTGTSLVWGYNTAGRFTILNDETPTPVGLIRFNHDNISVGIGHGALGNEFQGISANNTAIGENALPNSDRARYNTAIGGNALQNVSTTSGGNFFANTGIGYSAGGGITTGIQNVCIGYNCGVTANLAGSTCNYNTMIGVGCDMSGGTFNTSSCIGYGAKIDGNNLVVLGGDTETVVCRNKLKVGKEILLSAYSTIITANFDIGAQSVYNTIYCVNPTSAITITLPTANATNAGLRFVIRRVGGSGTLPNINISPQFYPANSLTLTTTLLGASAYTGVLYCAYLTSTTFAWFREG